ncbi:hypothetical protein [Amaricoccus solimangrovi]|uniref:Uncharacterized protein n=1 Tax=Amaricoccus solimangrovi TaxID=2589815 RepID=A0A501WVB1_9RHOB|nr:hypothetical protein [Amaricoccus solimangrovi]TPE53219.1 hypothetical protein FJM51_04155 [Amaricoccus solimangrovi]
MSEGMNRLAAELHERQIEDLRKSTAPARIRDLYAVADALGDETIKAAKSEQAARAALEARLSAAEAAIAHILTRFGGAFPDGD